ncbi:MAG: tetratricopeptide repeat protein [Bacteroidales bacterium]|nr:tetratricopeptide repeat protein [Bacteroidales bacterium]
MKKFFVVGVMWGMVLTGSMAWGQRTTDESRQRELYRQAMDLYGKQKYAAAQQIFDEIALGNKGRADLTTADASYFGGVCSEKLDNNDASFRLEEFLRLYPQSSRCNMARFYLGNFRYARGDYGAALDYYKLVDAREVEFNHRAEYNFKMGYCYFHAGDTKKASQLFAQQVGGQSKYRNSSLYYYAHIQYMNGEYEPALKNFKELEKDKKFAKIAPSYIARIYYYLGREDDLLEMAPGLLGDKDAFRRNEVHQMVGEIYFNRGEYQKALEQYKAVDEAAKREQTQSCTPQDNDYQIGYCHYQTGNYREAAEYLRRKTACDDSVAQNALYVLGDCYLKMGDKRNARSMFLQASKMGFCPSIKEDALFNYAKLSCELNENAYNESIRSFETYLRDYPQTKHKTEVQEILTELYCSTNNYKDAILLLEQIPQRNATLEQAYQRAVLNRGIELCNSGKSEEGEAMYAKAVSINAVPRITADANYLLGEAQYRKGQYDQAERSMNKLLLSSFSKTSPYANDARYTYGYLLMRKKEYAEAYETFSELETRLRGASSASAGGRDKEQQMSFDVWNRMGDCLYVQSRFSDAIAMYDKVIAGKPAAKDADYATYQKALAYGAMGRNSEKLTYLNYIFEQFDNSPLRSKAMLEIANTYMMCDNNEMAMTYYNNFMKQYPKSVYVKSALLNQGLIYYNTDRYDQALRSFDRLLTEYPGTPESRDALGTVKNIYIAQNRVADYFPYVERTTKVKISNVEQDSTIFLAAEERYQEGEYDVASVGLEDYLQRFPNGLFSLKAHYILADSYNRQQRYAQALPHYEWVARSGANQYSEQALAAAAGIAFGMGDYAKASPLYGRMAEGAESDQSLLQGELGLLRCAVMMGQHEAIIAAGQRLKDEGKATTEMKEEASLSMARACFDMRRFDSAFAFYGELAASANGDYNGEARCRQAEILMLRGSLDEAERKIERFVGDASSDYWLAYSFILWADIYYARGNNLQAKQTLQSIIDNYDGEELVAVARQKYAAIVAAEQPKTPAEPDEMIIEL